jgi:hypothetical protein
MKKMLICAVALVVLFNSNVFGQPFYGFHSYALSGVDSLYMDSGFPPPWETHSVLYPQEFNLADGMEANLNGLCLAYCLYFGYGPCPEDTSQGSDSFDGAFIRFGIISTDQEEINHQPKNAAWLEIFAVGGFNRKYRVEGWKSDANGEKTGPLPWFQYESTFDVSKILDNHTFNLRLLAKADTVFCWCQKTGNLPGENNSTEEIYLGFLILDANIGNQVRVFISDVQGCSWQAFSDKCIFWQSISAKQFFECSQLLPGDANQDCNVDILDVLAVVNDILGITPLTPEQKIIADVNEDGSVDIVDAIQIINIILGT